MIPVTVSNLVPPTSSCESMMDDDRFFHSMVYGKQRANLKKMASQKKKLRKRCLLDIQDSQGLEKLTDLTGGHIFWCRMDDARVWYACMQTRHVMLYN